MRGKLFEDLVVSARSGRPVTRTLALPASAGLHVAVALGAAVAALTLPERLPPPELAGQVPPYVPEVRVILPPAGGRPAGARPPRRGTPAPTAPAASALQAPPVVPDALPDPDLTHSKAPASEGSGAGSGTRPGDPPGVPGGDPNAVGGGGPDSGAAPLVRGGDIQPPRLLRSVKPAYPDIARQVRLQGEVELQCIIDTDGRVIDVTVVRGHPILNSSAVEAVQQWVYTPTRLNGAPVRVLLTVKVKFTLQ